MTVAKAEGQELARNGKGSPRAWRGGAVLLGALLLSWPAFLNGFPLLYPDSMTYLWDGHVVARALFLHRLSDYYGVRSFFYSLGILPFHWNISPWPIVALQSLLVAWIVWLLVRSFQARAFLSRSVSTRRIVASYLLLILFISLLTSVSWYACFIMPDVLGPLLYLSFYLLAFARDTLSRTERWGLYLIAAWGITAHASHLLLAACLFVLLVLFAAFEPKPFWRRLRSLGELAAIIAVAAAAQMALHGYLYGKPTLNGIRPPYLMARIVADGTGRLYLEKNCPRLQWAVCNHISQFTDNPDDFLWETNGAYEDASDTEKTQMEQEEMPMVLATIRAYPLQQLSRSTANFWNQFVSFGVYGFDPNDWMLAQFDQVFPRERPRYLQSRQAHGALPLELFTVIDWWTIVASLGAIAVLIPFLWRRHSPRLAGLTLVVAGMVVANAWVTGVLSVVDDRYQCRVIWLVPLLAGIFFLDWLGQRKGAALEP
ncbi:MAG: hypothetical protein ABR990_12365 [Terracidiphilus sp.]|jgi:hypothetical protein